MTIQMPVYKEGLKGVVIPTVTTLLAAVRNYEEQGGTASIYVNDDGMQCVKPELAEYVPLRLQRPNLTYVGLAKPFMS